MRLGRAAAVSDPEPSSPGVASWIVPMAIVVLAYSVPIGGDDKVVTNPNELSRVLLATSLAVNGSIVVNEPIDVYGSTEDRAERDGNSYSDKAPGLSFLSAPITAALRPLLPTEGGSAYPAYWPLRNVLTWLMVALPAAVLPFALLSRYPALDPRRRPAAALVLALTTPLFTYATVFFSHVPAAVLCAGSYALALRPGRSEGAPTARAAALSGLLSGFAVVTEYHTAIIGGIIFITLIGRRAGWRCTAGFVAGGLAAIAPLLAYHHAAFGSVFTTGYASKALAYHAAIHARGFFGVSVPTAESLWGVLASARRGIFFYAPIFLLLPVGLAAMARRARRDLWPLAGATVAYIAFASGYVDWPSGWCAAARYLVPVMGVWLFPLADGIETMLGAPWRTLVLVALVAVSLVQMVLSLALTPFFPWEFHAPLMQVTVRSLMEGAAAANLLSAVTSAPPVLAIGLWACFVALAVGAALVRMRPSGAPGTWIPIAMAAAVALSLSCQWKAQPSGTPDLEDLRGLVLQRLGYPEMAREIWMSLPR